jgi:propanediol dehydratase small subunit
MVRAGMSGLLESDFAGDQIHERPVEMADGTSRTLFFRELDSTHVQRYYMWATSADEDVRAAASARLVAAGLCNPVGSPALTFERAARLKPMVLKRIVEALEEVNGMRKPKTEAPDLGKS